MGYHQPVLCYGRDTHERVNSVQDLSNETGALGGVVGSLAGAAAVGRLEVLGRVDQVLGGLVLGRAGVGGLCETLLVAGELRADIAAAQGAGSGGDSQSRGGEEGEEGNRDDGETHGVGCSGKD